MDSKRKIVFLTIDYWPNNYGGMGIHLYNIAHILSEWYDITIIYMNLSLEERIESTRYWDQGLEIIEIPIKYKQICEKYNDGLSALRYMLSMETGYHITSQIEKIIDFNKNNIIVHSHCEAFNMTCDYLRFRYNVPVVNTIHYKSWESLREIQSAWIYSMLQNSDKCIFVSDWLKRDLFKFTKKYEGKCVVIHNGVTRSKLPIERNIIKEKFRICCIGTLKKRKGFDRLLVAVSNMRNKSQVVIDIVGEGKEKSSLLNLANKLRLNVNFVGYLEYELTRKKIHESNVVVVPSREEAFGLVVLEAMAERKCLIASNLGGIVELVNNDNTGILVDSTEEIRDALDYLYEHPYELERISDNAFLESQKYDWDYIAEETKKVYEQIENKYFVTDSVEKIV